MRRPKALRQVALSAGRDIDTTLAFWHDVFGLPVHARYDPPGIAFIIVGGIRLFFTGGVPQGTVYLDIDDLDPRAGLRARRRLHHCTDARAPRHRGRVRPARRE